MKITNKTQINKANFEKHHTLYTRSEGGEYTQNVKQLAYSTPAYKVVSITRGCAPVVELYATLTELKKRVNICHW